MLIKMLSTLSGSEFSAQPGQKIEVNKTIADQLISGGFAVPVKTIAIERTELPIVETTDLLETEATELPINETTAIVTVKNNGKK